MSELVIVIAIAAALISSAIFAAAHMICHALEQTRGPQTRSPQTPDWSPEYDARLESIVRAGRK